MFTRDISSQKKNQIKKINNYSYISISVCLSESSCISKFAENVQMIYSQKLRHSGFNGMPVT